MMVIYAETWIAEQSVMTGDTQETAPQDQRLFCLIGKGVRSHDMEELSVGLQLSNDYQKPSMVIQNSKLIRKTHQPMGSITRRVNSPFSGSKVQMPWYCSQIVRILRQP